MKKRTKIIIVVSILLVIAIIGIFCLAVYLDKKIGVNIVTVVNTYDNRMVYAAVATERGINYPLNHVIIKDLNLNENLEKAIDDVIKGNEKEKLHEKKEELSKLLNADISKEQKDDILREIMEITNKLNNLK